MQKHPVLLALALFVGVAAGLTSPAAALSPLPPPAAMSVHHRHISAAPAPAPQQITFCDSASVTYIPDCAAYLGYVDGHYVTAAALRERYPSARILTISTTGANRATVLDVEPGDATIAEARAWIAAGLGTVIYSDVSDKPLLDRELQGLDWQWWAADPTGCTPHLVAGSIATQYCWTPHYDLSVTQPGWPGPAQPTPVLDSTPPAPPSPSDIPLP